MITTTSPQGLEVEWDWFGVEGSGSKKAGVMIRDDAVIKSRRRE